MKTASVTETKNRLSAILDQVREGETFLILDRGRPVARLEPVRGDEGNDADDARLADLIRRGIVVKHGSGRVPRHIIETPPPKPGIKFSILQALLDEREEGR